METSTKYVDYLDGWRGLAIALVLEDHFFALFPFDAGRMGVDVFFCLSGFLMSGILFIQMQPLRKFYKRRISRILPAFLLFVAAIYTFAAWDAIPFTWAEVASTLLFLRTYLPLQPGIWATPVPIGHLWSLNIEEHSYLFMSIFIILGLFRKNRGVGLLLSGVGCMMLAIVYSRIGDYAPHSGGIGSEVAASHILVAAGYRLIREKYDLRVPAYAPLLAMAAALLCYTWSAPWWAHSMVTPFLLAFAINHLSQTYNAVKDALALPALRRLGAWSFSIYLWQQPFQSDVITLRSSAVGLSCTMAIALFSYYVIEQPSRSWLNKNW